MIGLIPMRWRRKAIRALARDITVITNVDLVLAETLRVTDGLLENVNLRLVA